MSVRQQMRMASVYYQGMFEVSQYCLPEKVVRQEDIVNTSCTSVLWVRIKEFMSPTAVACSEMVYQHQKYSKGDLVVMELIDGIEELKVGVVEAIVAKEDGVFLVLRTYEAVKHKLCYYESYIIGSDYVITDIRSLVDRKPLKKHGTDLKFQFVLHHYLSHDQ